MEMISRRNFLISSLAASAVAPAFAQGASFPTGQVRMIVPFPAGGATDVISRVLTHNLQVLWGQSVLQEYQPGASGLIGTKRVAQSAPDGYTLLLASTGAILALAASNADPNYRITQDLAPISLMSAPPYILVVAPQVPAKTTAELIAYAKSNPGQLSFASSGNGTITEGGVSDPGTLTFITTGTAMWSEYLRTMDFSFHSPSSSSSPSRRCRITSVPRDCFTAGSML